MKQIMGFILSIIGVLMFSTPAISQDISNKEIIKELKILQKRTDQLENKLTKKGQEIEILKKQTSHIAGHPEERLPSKTEEAKKTWELSDRIELSGVIEVEFGSEKHEVRYPGTMDPLISHNHDITLATVEMGMDVDINKYTKGHLVFLYEEDEDENRIRIDEGSIQLGGVKETYGLYLLAGKYYPHFGELNSWFISDPMTLEIFEIQESAVQAGYEGDWFTVCAGAFHGDIQELNKDESRIKGFFADANFHNPEDTIGGISLLLGASYLSNVADTNTLQEENNIDLNTDGDPDMQIKNNVDGFAVYLTAEYSFFSFGAEYITALDDFIAGEMAYAIDKNGVEQSTKPTAWNIEFVISPIDSLQLGIKYEETKDMFSLFPEEGYGGVISWELFNHTVLSAEYMHGEYDENNLNTDGLHEDKVDIITMQLAIEF